MAYRSRERRGGDDEQFTLNLTPLLDVVLQLITFFMMLIHFGSRVEGETIAVKLPVTPAALPGSDLAFDRLTVALDDRGRLLTGKGQDAREGDAAETWWAEQAALRRGGQETLGGPAGELPTVVVVRADRRATYGAVRRALTSAQGRGFAHFSLVVLRSPEETPAMSRSKADPGPGPLPRSTLGAIAARAAADAASAASRPTGGGRGTGPARPKR